MLLPRQVLIITHLGLKKELVKASMLCLSRMEVHKLTGVDTDIIAVDKDNAGNIKFEVICKCPGCKTKNKFYAVAE